MSELSSVETQSVHDMVVAGRLVVDGSGARPWIGDVGVDGSDDRGARRRWVYALELMKGLGLEERGGGVRVGVLAFVRERGRGS
jgi:hypothetical protein